MAKKQSIDQRLLDFVENHRIVIGAALVVAIVGGTLTLSIVNRKPQIIERPVVDAAVEEEISELRKQNDLLRKQIEEINAARVAGASTQLENREAKNKKTTTTSKTSSEAGSKTSNSSAVSSKLININTADQKALESLPRIGPAIAGRIIEYRSANDGFKTIEDIKKVKGIGDKIFEQIKNQITVE